MRIAKIVIALALVAAFVVAVRVLPIGPWIEHFKSYVLHTGSAGYALYIAAYVVCCVFIVPAFALTIGAGAIFGVVRGAIVVVIGATLGATAAFLLGRTVFRHRVERFVASNPKLAAVDRAIAKEGTKLMLLMRLSGFPPFTWINYALGLTGVGITPYLLTTFFGIIPGTIAFVYAGAAGAAVATGSGNRISLIITAVGAVAVSVYIARIAAAAIRRAGVEQA